MTRRQRRLRGPTGLVPTAVAIVLALLTTSIFVFSPSLNPLDILSGRMFQVVVPEVVGLTQTRALVRLEDTRLHGAVDFGYSSSVPRGYVMGQDPAPEGMSERGETVDLVVSRGPAIFTLRDYVGEAESAVRRELEEFELDFVITRVNSEDVPQGKVISHTPDAGSLMQSGGELALVVSLGPIARPVPELLLLPFEGAVFLMGKAGFTLGELTFADNGLVPLGAIISTDPEPGTLLDRDKPIDIVVSTGPPPRDVPRVVGSQQADAARELTAAGFVVGEVSQVGTVNDPNDGRVLKQVPAPGTSLRPGEIVTLTVRRSQAPPPPPTTTTIPPPPTTTTTTITTTTTTIKAKPNASTTVRPTTTTTP